MHIYTFLIHKIYLFFSFYLLTFYSWSFLKIVIFAGVATCDIIKTSTVDLYLLFYSSDWFEVTQTTVVCLKW